MKIEHSPESWIKIIGYVCISLYAWLNSHGIDAYTVTVLMIFMTLDMILGVWKSIVVPELENPTSKKAKRGILAKIVMLIIPIVCGLIWGAFDTEDGFRIANIMLSALMVAEGYSNITNAFSIYARKDVQEFDAISFVFKKITEKIRKLLETLFN